MAKMEFDAHFSEPTNPQCCAIQQEVQNSWCMYVGLLAERRETLETKMELFFFQAMF